MKALSAIDAAFLFMETDATPMHIGSLHVLAVPNKQRGSFVARLRRHMASRLALAPVLTRVARFLPLNLLTPYWDHVEAPDLDYHVHVVHLGKSGTRAALDRQVAALHQTLLDRAHPLWQMVVIEGLGPEFATPKGTRAVALYAKVHHAGVDGQGGIALANAILDLSAEGRELSERARPRRSNLGLAALVSGALSHQLAQVSELARKLPKAWAMVQKSRAEPAPAATSPDVAVGAQKTGRTPALRFAPRTRFNGAVSGKRRFASLALPLAELKHLGKQRGASINDMVLAILSGALRRYLSRHDELPAQPLVAAVPLSLRAANDASNNNQVAMTVLDLPTHLSSANARLAAISEKSRSLKQGAGGMRGLIPTDFPSLGLPWLVSSLSKLYARSKLAERVPPLANVVISNVPGPQFPLYLAGAQVLSYVPVSIVAQGLALNLTVQSFDGQLHFGLIACAEAVPDLAKLAKDVSAAWTELARAIGQERASP